MADEQKFQMQPLVEVTASHHLVQSPTVGYYTSWPVSGTLLTGGAFIGRLKVLNTYYDLYLPGDAFGRVEVTDRDFTLPVAYGEELFRLIPENNIAGPEKKTPEAAVFDAEDIAAEGGHVITAFTTGIFYARPAPDSPPFVTEGQEIEKGKALGLIEVMKTFNHIIFQGIGESSTGKVKKVLVKDSQEVKLGQPLFVIE